MTEQNFFGMKDIYSVFEKSLIKLVNVLDVDLFEVSYNLIICSFLIVIVPEWRKILADKPTGKRTLGRPRRRWEHYIRMELEEIGINVGNWVDSVQDRNYWRALVNAPLNLRVP